MQFNETNVSFMNYTPEGEVDVCGEFRPSDFSQTLLCFYLPRMDHVQITGNENVVDAQVNVGWMMFGTHLLGLLP